MFHSKRVAKFLLSQYIYCASKAITEMNGRVIGSEPIYVNYRLSKEDQKAQLAQQSFWKGVSGMTGRKVRTFFKSFSTYCAEA